MTHKFENDILIECIECKIDIEKKIKEGKSFKIKKIHNTTEKSRNKVLHFLISILWHKCDYDKSPQACREKITKSLLEHGQFSKEEIDRVFKENSYESTDYSQEFVENHEEIDFEKLFDRRYELSSGKTEEIVETKYHTSLSSCDYKIHLGFCKIKVEAIKCPDCGLEVINTPDNVTWGYEHHLVCPRCIGQREDEFDMKGIVKFGNPEHHGSWNTQEPEFFYTGTDYFAIFHPNCKKAKGDDKKGFMEVNGVWVDDCGRIVLSLKCRFCGARNALKPFTTRGKIPLLNQSEAEWKRVESPILEMISNEENNNVEFKSSLRWDYREKNVNKELEYEVVEAIAGFMNAEGGHLLIGVRDDKKILGLEKDYSTLGAKKNSDGFQLQLSNIIKNCIGVEFNKFIKIDFENVYEEEICHIEIDRSPKEVFFKDQSGKKQFAVRMNNSTEILDSEKTVEYCKMHWGE